MAQDFAKSFAEIVKFNKNDDGTLTVYGKATSDDLDIDLQICDNDWLKKAMPDWFKSGGNIREQHSSIAAGVATDYEEKADGFYITANVVDPVSCKKVEAKVLKGFSIGIKAPRVIRDTKAANGRIVDGQIVEVSLVDRPANPTCQLVLAKSVGGESTLTQVEELIEKYNDNHDEQGRFSSGGGSGNNNSGSSSSYIPNTGDVQQQIETGYSSHLEWSSDEGSKLDSAQVREDAIGHLHDAQNSLKEGDTRAAAQSMRNVAGVLDEHPAYVTAANTARQIANGLSKSTEGDLEKRDFSASEREDAADAGQALPDGSYPIKSIADLKNAIQAFGRAKNPAKAKQHIITRARALGAVDQLPEGWNVKKSPLLDVKIGRASCRERV